MRQAELYSALSGAGSVPPGYSEIAVMKYMSWDYWQYRRCPLSVLNRIADWMEAENMARKAQSG